MGIVEKSHTLAGFLYFSGKFTMNEFYCLLRKVGKVDHLSA